VNLLDAGRSPREGWADAVLEEKAKGGSEAQRADFGHCAFHDDLLLEQRDAVVLPRSIGCSRIKMSNRRRKVLSGSKGWDRFFPIPCESASENGRFHRQHGGFAPPRPDLDRGRESPTRGSGEPQRDLRQRTTDRWSGRDCRRRPHRPRARCNDIPDPRAPGIDRDGQPGGLRCGMRNSEYVTVRGRIHEPGSSGGGGNYGAMIRREGK
jgi:hypothetical protein